MNSDQAIHEALRRALLDLEASRLACRAVLETDQFAAPQDRIRAASELRLLNRERLEILDRIQKIEDQAKTSANVADYLGTWMGDWPR